MQIRFTVATAIALTASLAHADYVGHVRGLDGGNEVESLTVNAGDSFTGAVMLDGSAGTRSDFALLRLVFSVSNLEFESGWYDWSSPFTTGGVDDFSRPGIDTSGVITADTYLDPFAVGSIDVAFENVSDSFGQVFSTGLLLTFTLTVPETFDLGSFTIDFVPDTFADGASFVEATAGTGLTVNVIPAPASLLVAGFGGIAACRRRR